jgi:hypothetical protein
MRLHVLSSFTPSVFTVLALLASGCASHDGITGTTEVVEAKPKLLATIASVQLIQDCPDPEPAAVNNETAKPSAAMPLRDESMARGASADGTGSFRQPCTQSTMQLALKHDASEAQRVEVVAVRLMRAGKDGVLGTLPARKPSKWNESGTYDAWDERVPVGSELKVSYRLGEPDWTKVQEKLGDGEDPYGQRYILEVDLKMGGTTTTVRSPEFAREFPHVVVT